jgi:hypothetical protein
MIKLSYERIMESIKLLFEGLDSALRRHTGFLNRGVIQRTK